MIRVYLADDHDLVRAGMKLLLSGCADLVVAGEAVDGRAALRDLADPGLAVDVLVLDLSLPRLNGLEVLARVRALRPHLPVLVVSMHPDEAFAARVLADGAAGYLCKSRSEREFVDAIRTVATGRVYAARATLDHARRPPHRALSARETQIFLLLVTGSSVSDIAAELDLTPSTVSTHVARIRGKLGVRSVAELTSYAHREGLIG